MYDVSSLEYILLKVFQSRKNDIKHVKRKPLFIAHLEFVPPNFLLEITSTVESINLSLQITSIATQAIVLCIINIIMSLRLCEI